MKRHLLSARSGSGRGLCGSLLVATGAAWFLLDVLDIAYHTGFYGAGTTPAGLELALGVLLAVTVTTSVASGSVTAARRVAILLVVTACLRAVARGLALIPTPQDIDTSAPLAVLNTVLVGTTLVAVIATVVVAVSTRPAQSAGTWMIVLSLVAAVLGGLGVPVELRIFAAVTVSLSLMLAGATVLREGR